MARLGSGTSSHFAVRYSCVVKPRLRACLLALFTLATVCLGLASSTTPTRAAYKIECVRQGDRRAEDQVSESIAPAAAIQAVSGSRATLDEIRAASTVLHHPLFQRPPPASLHSFV